jgi:hypothetical protein
MTAWSELERQVQRRAAARCEYCLMHESLQGATFHVEHVLPRSRGGGSTLDNLAWACPSCNLRKSDRIHVSDPATGSLVPLFNPRTDRWAEHFQWVDRKIVSLTPVGRATVAALELNAPRRLRIREAEKLFNLFPPPPT